MTESTLTKKQTKTYGPKEYTEDGHIYRITATVRYDDQYGNGHNSFSITADIDRKSGNRWVEDSSGCPHDEVAKHFPELAPFLKWRLCSSGGPLHYVANTVYHAGDRDYNGLRKGEVRQLGEPGRLAWKLEATADLPNNVDAGECPSETATLRYVPWTRVGEGKERDLDAARSTAIWPDATDEELTAPGLEDRLRERLPALLAEFRAAVESLGFTY